MIISHYNQCAMKKYKPLFNRVIVFSVPVRRKLSHINLYLGNAKRGSYNRAEEIWIVDCGQLCKEKLAAGTHAWLNDSFELEPTDLSLWDYCRELPEFARLKDFVDSVDGDVRTSIVSEDSILAVDDGYEIQTQAKTMPKD